MADAYYEFRDFRVEWEVRDKVLLTVPHGTVVNSVSRNGDRVVIELTPPAGIEIPLMVPQPHPR